MGQARKHAWQDIQAAYVYDSGESFRGLARRFNVKYTKIQARAKAEEWRRQRRERLADVESKVSEEMAAERAELTMSTLRLSMALYQKLFTRLTEDLDRDRPLEVVEEITTVTRVVAGATIEKTVRATRLRIDSPVPVKLLAAHQKFVLRLYQMVWSRSETTRNVIPPTNNNPLGPCRRRSSRGLATGQIRKHPWHKIRAHYVHNPDATLRGLGRQFRVRYSKIQLRAQAEGWAKQREEFMADVESRVRKKMAAECAELTMSTLRLTMAFYEKYLTRLIEDLDRDLSLQVVEEITTVTCVVDGATIEKTTRATRLRTDSPFAAKLLAAHHEFVLGLYQVERSRCETVRNVTEC